MFFSPCTVGAILVGVCVKGSPSQHSVKSMASTRSVTQFAQINKPRQVATDKALRKPLKSSQFTYRVQQNKAVKIDPRDS